MRTWRFVFLFSLGLTACLVLPWISEGGSVAAPAEMMPGVAAALASGEMPGLVPLLFAAAVAAAALNALLAFCAIGSRLLTGLAALLPAAPVALAYARPDAAPFPFALPAIDGPAEDWPAVWALLETNYTLAPAAAAVLMILLLALAVFDPGEPEEDVYGIDFRLA